MTEIKTLSEAQRITSDLEKEVESLRAEVERLRSSAYCEGECPHHAGTAAVALDCERRLAAAERVCEKARTALAHYLQDKAGIFVAMQDVEDELAAYDAAKGETK